MPSNRPHADRQHDALDHATWRRRKELRGEMAQHLKSGWRLVHDQRTIGERSGTSPDSTDRTRTPSGPKTSAGTNPLTDAALSPAGTPFSRTQAWPDDFRRCDASHADDERRSCSSLEQITGRQSAHARGSCRHSSSASDGMPSART